VTHAWLLAVVLLAVDGGAALPGKTLSGDGGVVRLDLSRHVDEVLELQGSKAAIPWQHMVTTVEGKTASYLDLEDGNQVVVYLPKGGWPAQRVVLRARVMKVEGRSKRPGAAGAARVVVEYQLDVLDIRSAP
jgi:hypothetical protein